jgi:hypothetical protein
MNRKPRQVAHKTKAKLKKLDNLLENGAGYTYPDLCIIFNIKLAAVQGLLKTYESHVGLLYEDSHGKVYKYIAPPRYAIIRPRARTTIQGVKYG